MHAQYILRPDCGFSPAPNPWPHAPLKSLCSLSMLSRIPAVVVTCTAIALLCVAAFPFHHPAPSSALLELQGMVGGQVRVAAPPTPHATLKFISSTDGALDCSGTATRGPCSCCRHCRRPARARPYQPFKNPKSLADPPCSADAVVELRCAHSLARHNSPQWAN